MFSPEGIEQYDLDEIQKELCEASFYDFLELAWPIIEPSRPFVPNWHLEAMCEHLEACYYRDIRRLAITVPPGTTKSVTTSIAFPAWVWLKNAKEKFIFGSYSETVSKRDSIRCRRLIGAMWYRRKWGNVRIDPKMDNLIKFANLEGGFRTITTIKGGITGEHADFQVVDDPIKPLEVSKSLTVAQNTLEEVREWWSGTMATRIVDHSSSVRIIIMQRLHEADLAGDVISEGYEHLMIPMEYEKERTKTTSIGFVDPRTEERELLCPERFDREAVEQLKKDLGKRGAEAQLQQNPTPKSGSILKEEYIQYYTKAPAIFQKVIQSWDCTFKEDGTSFVVGQVWGTVNEYYYLLDQVRGRWGLVDTCKQIKLLSKKHPRAKVKLVEAKANGNAVVDTLQRQMTGFKLIEPEGGKVVRVHAIEHLWEEGRVFLPLPENCEWVVGLVDEVTGFPAREFDDQVDSMSQALVYLQSKRIERLRKAMQNLSKRGMI